jgi:hypothetical protein
VCLKHDERSEVGLISSGSLLLLVNHLVYFLIFFYLYRIYDIHISFAKIAKKVMYLSFL